MGAFIAGMERDRAPKPTQKPGSSLRSDDNAAVYIVGSPLMMERSFRGPFRALSEVLPGTTDGTGRRPALSAGRWSATVGRL